MASGEANGGCGLRWCRALALFLLIFGAPLLSNGQGALDFCQLLLSRWDQDQSLFRVRIIADGTFVGRPVKYLLPQGPAPRGGWPAVIVFQGSNSPIQFARPPHAVMGLKYETELIQQLLNAGFAVLAPMALGGISWQTNLPIARDHYTLSSDYILMKNLLRGLEQGDFGSIRKQSLFAAGFSSGGYHVSRMGLVFPDRFRAFAIQAASYATCIGAYCVIPNRLPEFHPPTLLIAGEKDLLVPVATVRKFHEKLNEAHIPARLIIKPDGGHGWFAESPQLIVDWFRNYL